MGLARSTRCDQVAAMRRPDKYAAPRWRAAELSGAGGRAWGPGRIWAEPRRPHDGAEPAFASERAVRRAMAEGGMRVRYRRAAKARGSHRGEAGEHPGNHANGDFSAAAPNRLWLTDITRLSLPGLKRCLSPVVDCFDGEVVAWSPSRSPSARLASSMLERACSTLAPGEAPTAHSDCGCHHRWPGRIAICGRHGLGRPMSPKGRSPDNSAMEGFFGRMKNEMLHHRDWPEGTTYERFGAEVAAYMEGYNETGIKRSLGRLSPSGHRRSLGIAV